MGINQDFEVPKMPDLVVENYGSINSKEALGMIINTFEL